MGNGRLRLCVGPVLFCLLDGALTLQGQSEAYWAGDYRLANEGNPLGRWPLERHPLLFAAVLLCWVLVFSGFILRLRENLAHPLAFAVQFGHTLGAASWLLRAGDWGASGCCAAILLVVASRLILDLAWRLPTPT